MGESICASFFTFVLFFGALTTLVMSGVGFHYFQNPWVLSGGRNNLINIKILFGCGIGLSFIILISIIVFLLSTKPICNTLWLLSLVALTCSLYISFTTSGSCDRFLHNWDTGWDDADLQATVFSLQWENGCCGWTNASDRGVMFCPDEFESGCARVAGAYLRPRFHEVFVAAIVCLTLIYVSVGVIAVCTICVEQENSPRDVIFVLSDI
jgi:hypothetical protein